MNLWSLITKFKRFLQIEIWNLSPWRRRDNNPAKKDIFIVDAKTNTVLEKRYVLEINNEYGHLIFKPNNQSLLYYVYFLPLNYTGSY